MFVKSLQKSPSGPRNILSLIAISLINYNPACHRRYILITFIMHIDIMSFVTAPANLTPHNRAHSNSNLLELWAAQAIAPGICQAQLTGRIHKIMYIAFFFLYYNVFD